MNEDTPGNPENYPRMFTQMSGSAGHGDGHHVIPPYRMAPYSLNSSYPMNTPVLPPANATRHILQPQQPQQAHWVLSANMETPAGAPTQSQQLQQQQQQRQSVDQFQRLKVEDALSYLDKVKAQFGGQPQVYNDFLDIMKEFKSQAIDTPVVISRVSHLFAGQKELIVGFNTFLPPGFKIIEEGSSQTLNLCQPGHQTVPLASLAAGSSNPPFRSSEPPSVRSVPTAVAAAAAAASAPPQHHQGHLGPQLQTPPGQPMEFDHAINYVNKIKVYYQGRPEIYKAFLDILHNYQKEQKNIKESSKGHQSSKSSVTETEVYNKVANLFQDNPELLVEFRQFLPDANGNASLINGLGVAESALRGGTGGGLASSLVASGMGPDMSGRGLDHSNLKCLHQSSHRHQSMTPGYNMPPSKKRKLSRDSLLSSVKTEPMLTDREYFDQLKRTAAGDPLFKEMFKCIDHYNAGSISAEDLLDMTGPLMSKMPELKPRLIGMVESDRRTAAEKKDKDHQWHLDLSSCKHYEDQPNYRILPKKKKLVGRAEKKAATSHEDQVLNEEYAVFADPDARRETTIWHCAKLSAYEEVVLQTEDERYELDMVMQPHYDVMNGLGEVHKMLQKMSADEQARFQMTELSSCCHMAEIHIQRVLKKLYNNKWDTVYEGLKKIPSVALGIVLNRMQEKCVEWEESKKKFNQCWQESCLKQRLRYLEQQGSKFKNMDGKQFKLKTLIKEVEDLAKARDLQVDEPLMTLPFQDSSIIYDTVQLITIVSKRQAGVPSDEMLRLKWILKTFVEDLFHVPCIKEESEIEGIRPEDQRDSPNDKSQSSRSLRQTVGRRGAHLKLNEATSVSRLEDDEEEAVTAFYCSDNWYVLFRIFVVLCDRLAFFVKHAEDMPDDDRKDFSQAWPASISTALEQHMQEHGHARRSYATFLWLTRNLLNGVLDLGVYEELIRDTFGLDAYVAFTIDKLVQSIVRHILQIATSSECTDLLKLFEKHQKPNRKLDAKSLEEYNSEARSIISDDENCYLIKTTKKSGKGRMAIWLLSRSESCASKPTAVENPAPFKDWEPISPMHEDEQPSECPTTAESVPVNVRQNFPDFDSVSTFETSDSLPKSAPTFLWSSMILPVRKSPLFVRRNFTKAQRQRIRSNRIKETTVKSGEKGAPSDLTEEEEEEEDEEEDEDLDGTKTLMEKLSHKDFLLMRLTSLPQAKQTHMQLSRKKYRSFQKWLIGWEAKNVTEKETADCMDWFRGKDKDTRMVAIGNGDQLPYHAYVKYFVRPVNTNDSSPQ